MRKNKPVTDLKYNTKRRVRSIKGKIEEISYQWGDIDFFIVSRCDEILDKLSEIEAEISGVDTKTH